MWKMVVVEVEVNVVVKVTTLASEEVARARVRRESGVEIGVRIATGVRCSKCADDAGCLSRSSNGDQNGLRSHSGLYMLCADGWS